MTRVHRCDCAEPAVACVCHLRAPTRVIHDPSLASDDPLREVVTLLADPPPDANEEAANARAWARGRKRLDAPSRVVHEADEWPETGRSLQVWPLSSVPAR